MKATKLICSQNMNSPIRGNCQPRGPLPPAVQDLAELLADIVFRRLKSAEQPPQARPGEVS